MDKSGVRNIGRSSRYYLSLKTGTDASILKCLAIAVVTLGVIPFDKASLTLYLVPGLGNIISTALNAIALVWALFLVVKGSPDKKRDIFVGYVTYIFAVVFLITMIGEALNDNLSLSRFFSIVCLWGYYVLYILAFKKPKDALKTINIAASFLVFYSLVLYLIGNPNVLYHENATSNLFKGVAINRNGFVEFALLVVIANCFRLLSGSKHKTMHLFLVIAAAAGIVMTKSATSLICLITVAALIVFKPVLKKVYSCQIVFLCYFVLFLVLIVFQLPDVPLLGDLLENLGKSSDMTGRAGIWGTVLQIIPERLLFGYGIDSVELLRLGILVNDPHNSILYVQFTQGIVITILTLTLIVAALKKAEPLIQDNLLAYCCIASIVCWLIRSLSESVFSYTHFCHWIFVVLIGLIYIAKSNKVESGDK